MHRLFREVKDVRRTIVAAWNVPADGIAPALVILSVCLGAGGLTGCLLAARVGGAGETSLHAYLEAFLAAAQGGAVDIPALWSQVWDTLRWPLAALLLGFTALGVLGLPVLFAVRGFLLAFSIASFVRAFGGTGWLLACLVFGIGGALSLPVLFVLGVQSFLSARALAARVRGDGKGRVLWGRDCLIRCAMCGGVLCVCILLERAAVPALLSGAAGVLLNR